MTVESGGQVLIIDAGTGILQLENELRKTYPDYPQGLPYSPSILISHLHIDHIIGLSTFEPVMHKNSQLSIFTCSRDDRPLKEQIFGIFKPPYWPISIDKLTTAQCIAVKQDIPFVIGHFTVTAFDTDHPDTTLSFHITDGRKTIVYLLDSEVATMNPKEYKKMLDYCRGADLVVFDATYSPEDYPKCKSWGHSTIEDGVRLADNSGCKRILFSHFSQAYGDGELELWKRRLADESRFMLASDGFEFTL